VLGVAPSAADVAGSKPLPTAKVLMLDQDRPSRPSTSARLHLGARPRLHLLSLATAALLAAPPSALAGQTTTVLADADAYVAASSPTSNYGTATSIRGDNTPRIGYLRFTPQNLRGSVTRATLRVHTTTSSLIGFEARSVGATIWNERTVTYRSRPAVSSTVLSRSGAFSQRGWLSLDVTSVVRASGRLTLALVTYSPLQLQVSSRESGSTKAPRLVVDTASAMTDTTPPTAPSGFQARAGDGKVALSWSPSTDAVGVTGYRVYQDGALVGSPAATSFVAAGLVNGRTYTYAVKASDGAGNLSPSSTESSAVPAAVVPTATAAAVRPYDARSPWNMPIGSAPVVDAKSASLIAAVSDNNLPLTSDPDQYAVCVYSVSGQTPRRTVTLSGYFSSYDDGDNSRVGHGFAPTISNVPIPAGARPSAGSDGQIVLWDPTTGTEYSFWQFDTDAAGNYTATNGARYHTTSGNYGRFADGLSGRGAGTPYFAGLVRKWEIEQGRIDHAMAFAYNSPSGAFAYPASKSDGEGIVGADLPEGARLQLDPALTEADFDRWGLSPAAKVIATALQRYGMYVIDNSGSSKIYLEDRKTAGWDPSIDRHLTEKIPWTAFRVLKPPVAP
jgi:hypothetical protein